MSIHIYTVIVGNIGCVYSGQSKREADRNFAIYKEQSNDHYGRADGENVTAFCNDEIIGEHIGTLNHSDNW